MSSLQRSKDNEKEEEARTFQLSRISLSKQTKASLLPVRNETKCVNTLANALSHD